MTDVIEQQAIVPVPEAIRALEAALHALPEGAKIDFEPLTSHTFCAGLYTRQLFIPAGAVVVGKRHAAENLFVLLSGRLALATADGPVVLEAPAVSVTEPGTKRAVVAITDCLVMNVHANPDDERNLDALEARYIIPEALPAPEKQEVLT